MDKRLPSYSVAIRTLGTAGETFRRELESLACQSVPPERVLVYIAEGFSRPEFTVGKEEYVWVPRGMMSQRILRYDEIHSDCLLLLDDDVELSPDSAERLLTALVENDADCVGADVFRNHRMSLRTKIFAAVTSLVFPHGDRNWAFKIRRNGSFSYLGRPDKAYYPSQSGGGPASLWRKESFLRLRMEDELWLEQLGFPFEEDTLLFYKLYLNRGRLGILYDAGIDHLDAQSASGAFRKSPRHFYIRAKASLMVWWRTCYKNGTDTAVSRGLTAAAIGLKALWLIPVRAGSALVLRKPAVWSSHWQGLRDGLQECRSDAFRNLPPFCMKP